LRGYAIVASSQGLFALDTIAAFGLSALPFSIGETLSGPRRYRPPPAPAQNAV
jgi:hypothetical protein